MFAYCNNNPVNKCDPNGTWGADVHDGYNPDPDKDTNKHYYYFNFYAYDEKTSELFIIKEGYGTYYWAKEWIGYNETLSRALGYYDNLVDKLFGSTGPNWKEYDKWHFYTVDGKDVRFKISYDERNTAKVHLDLAENAYLKWRTYKLIYGENNAFTQAEYSRYKNNLIYGIVHLGYSLHPVQDVYAHTRDVCYQSRIFFPGRWFHLPDYVDDAEKHTYAVLGPTASKTLEILLTFYNSYSVLRLKQSYLH